jgi:PEGA domain
MRLLTWLAFVLSVLCAVVRPASAEDVESIVRRGVELRRQGKDLEALALFRSAAATQRAPRVLAQLALAEQSLGLWPQAEADFKEALGATSDPWIVKNRQALDEAEKVVEDHLGSLIVWGTPDGAEVTINGAVVGTLPQTRNLRLPVGSVQLAARAPGFIETTRQVQIGSGALQREHVELAATPKAPEISLAAAPASAKPVVSLEPGATEPGGQPEEARPAIYRRWWFWTAIGVVAVGATASVLLLRPKSNGCDSGATCGTWGGGS